MKKFFEKHDLFKIVGIMMLFTAILTWVLRYSVYQAGELMTFDETVKGVASILDTSTIGVFDFNTYTLLVLYYFTNVFALIFVIFAFYKVLGKSNVYNALVEKVANLFKGKEIILSAISLVFYAALTSVASSYLVGLVFVPFTISVFAKLKTDKITTLISSFGGIIVGALTATYSADIVGSLINTAALDIKYAYEPLGVVILGVVSIFVLLGLIYTRINSKNKLEATEDIFIEVEKSKKKHYNVIPLAITLVITAAIIIIAFMPWSAWKVTVFQDLHTKITEATILGGTYPIVFLGSQTLLALGEWDLFTLSSFLVLMMFIVKFVTGIKFNDLIEGIEEGLKASVKPVLLLVMIYAVLVFSVSYPVVPQIMSWINIIAEKVTILRPVSYFLNGIVVSIFTVDMNYVATLAGGLFSTFDNANIAALSLQAGYAFAGFIAPTSAVLMLGLSTLDIKFKDYFKFIWKFLIALAAIVLVVLYILLYV